MDNKRLIDMTAEDLRELVRAVVREESAASKPEEPPAYVTVGEAAKHFRVTRRTIYNWIERGAPARKLGGGAHRIDLRAMAEWNAGEPMELKAVP
ncbi:MAG: helix-turn-helix domain-containing protein [Candidatus Deferrimicrobiaceae bacterium]